VAPDADQACALLLDFPEPPHVALIDLILPNILGVAFAERLLGRYPHVRLVFMTGWLDHPQVEAARTRGAVLPKPFNLADLVAAVGQ
jgi:FixJ family two-component response regulator